jgi:glycosyltransferase involved in cell wall biosynthesis
MKVAVVTPYFKESDEKLERCHDSVLSQTYSNIKHIMVADGHPSSWTSGKYIEHLTLPVSHNDIGATPRALGALSAFSRGYDAVAFLDADNWYERNHIEIMVDKMLNENLDAVAATRSIYSLDHKFLYIDTFESKIENTVDTNCWLLSKKTYKFMPAWITDPPNHLINDMIFCKVLKANKISMAETNQATVCYVSNWGWHFEQAKLPIPLDAVWLARDSQGNHIKVTEQQKRELT